MTYITHKIFTAIKMWLFFAVLIRIIYIYMCFEYVGVKRCTDIFLECNKDFLFQSLYSCVCKNM